MKHRGYFYGGVVTTLHIMIYTLTFGHFLWLEGRVRRGLFKNWCRRFSNRPRKFVQPITEEEIVELVKNSLKVRCFGAGHSFNDGVVVDDTLISLDKYSGVIWKDLEKKQMAFKGGTRVRDVVQFLFDDGLAFAALPSHDAQSIAGVMSTDVHGTGNDWGFLSEFVVRLKLVDGKGVIHECQPADDLFKAAIGGVGAVGIITEVVLQAVDRFNIEQKFEISDLSFVQNNFEDLFAKNQHLSFLFFPFTEKCQISTWNCTKKPKSFLGPLREFVSISMDALLAAWFGNLLAYTKLLPKLSSLAHSLKRGTDLVMESNKGFNRTIYHVHQELEFTVPFEETFAMIRRFKELYETMYSQGLPYLVFEIRFSPGDHTRTLIGAGRERRSTWIDLVMNDSHGFEAYYAASEELMKQIGARPHLGKFCQSFKSDDLTRLHAEHFAKFRDLVQEHDPQKKFANEFTRRLFGD